MVVSQVRVSSRDYEAWADCIGAFLTKMGPAKFFAQLPLQLCTHDLTSLSYAQDSRSYLLQIARQKLKRADIAFFVEYFVPQVLELEK